MCSYIPLEDTRDNIIQTVLPENLERHYIWICSKIYISLSLIAVQ